MGSVATRAVILPRASRGALGGELHGDTMPRRVAVLGVVAGVFVVVGLVGLFWRQADELRFPGDPLPGAVDMLLGTSWATSWWWALGGASVFLLGCLLASRGRSSGWTLAALGLLPLVVFPGLTGHANGADQRILALAADAVHVTAAGVWIGSLGVILLVGRRSLQPLIEAFSPVAMVSVALLVASGAMASLRLTDAVSDYWTTEYGRILSLKVGLFLVVAAIGAWNWRRGRPKLGSPEGEGVVVRSASLEFVLAQVVLVVTAVLVRTSP